jgi:hypothetical protein
VASLRRPSERLTFVDLNLLPQEDGGPAGNSRLVLAGVALLVASVLLIPLSFANQGAADDVDRLHGEMERIDEGLTSAQLNLGQMRELRAQTDAAQQRIDELTAERDAVLGPSAELAGAVDALMQGLPRGSSVSSIDGGQGAVRLTGRAPSADAALDYARGLDAGGAFAGVQVVSLVSEAGGAVSFTVEVTV